MLFVLLVFCLASCNGASTGGSSRSGTTSTPSHQHNIPKQPPFLESRSSVHHYHHDSSRLVEHHLDNNDENLQLPDSPSKSKTKQRRTKPPNARERRLQQIITSSTTNPEESAGILAPGQRLRQDLLKDYDKGFYPFESIWKDTATPDGLRRGMNLRVAINFYKVHSVDITTSVIDLAVWLRLRWNDPRLTWDPVDYDNITSTRFWIDSGSGPGGETSEVWTPDLELWNLEEGVSETFIDTHLSVDNTGAIYWSRPGHIRAICKLDGLSEFPFDELSCTLEFGSWAYSGFYIRPTLMDGAGYSIGGSKTAGESYSEYTLQSASAEVYVYPPFPGYPEEDWPVLLYHVTFDRAWQPCSRGYILLQIVLNVIAFACFWIPPHVGERMGLAITAMLAAVASELVISEKLPNAAEITWFSKFSMASLMFATAALFESAAVIYFHYHTGDDLIPEYIKYFIHDQSYKDKKKEQTSNENAQELPGVNGGWLVPPLNNYNDDDDDDDDIVNGNLEKIDEHAHDNDNDDKDHDDFTSSLSQNTKSTTRRRKPSGNEASTTPESTTTTTSAPQDNDKIQQCRQQQEQAKRRLSRKLSMLEFQKNLSESTKLGIKTVLGRDADDFKSEREMRNNLKWQKVASSIDSAARVLFPVTFGVFLAFAFGVMK